MLDERFWSKVDVTSNCWHWTANKNNKGYGLFRPGGLAPKRLAHRLAFADRHGDIPSGMCVLHRCDNPACVNPDHLFLGTMQDNMTDKMKKGRHRYGVHRGDDHPSRINPSKILRGEQIGTSKLTAAKVIDLRTRLRSGIAVRRLARETGLSPKTLMNLRDRKTWAHVP